MVVIPRSNIQRNQRPHLTILALSLTTIHFLSHIMIELEVFYSQLSSIMEVLVRSAVADIGKLMEDYTASLLEISRGRSENEVTKSKSKLTDDRSRLGSQNEFSVHGKRLENGRSDSDQEAVQLECDLALYQNKNKNMPGQTSSHQHCTGWTDLRSSQESYQQQQICAQEHVSIFIEDVVFGYDSRFTGSTSTASYTGRNVELFSAVR